MKKTVLSFVLILSAFLSFSQQKGTGKAIIDGKTIPFEWTKYYDEKDNSYATTYLFIIQGNKWGLLIVHTRNEDGYNSFEYELEFRGSGTRYLANERTFDMDNLGTTTNGTMKFNEDEDDKTFEMKYVSAKQESIKVLAVENMYKNITLYLDK